MPVRRTLAIAAIVVIVLAFVAIGVTAALVAGRQLTKHDPTFTPSPSSTPTPTATLSR